MMPRFGMELVMSRGYERMTWYGRGPAETYIDRAFERVGVYASTVAGEWVEDPRPQANGNKIDVRWVEFTNDKGIGLRAEGMPLLSVEAQPRQPAGRRTGGLHLADSAAVRGVPESRLQADGRRRHRQLVGTGLPDGAVPDPGQPAVFLLVQVEADRREIVRGGGRALPLLPATHHFME